MSDIVIATRPLKQHSRELLIAHNTRLHVLLAQLTDHLALADGVTGTNNNSELAGGKLSRAKAS